MYVANQLFAETSLYYSRCRVITPILQLSGALFEVSPLLWTMDRSN